ncbi:MAG TPA: cytochrome c3 family protein [Nitrospirota bacterium]|nr:cytochrome c3 family protein [Nitrospirota bacterium]
MKTTKKFTWLLITLFLLRASSLWADAGAGKAEQSHDAFLAGMHVAKAIDCAACHGEKTVVDDNETAVNAQCIQCHGSLATMAEKSNHAINPHKSHLGNVSCTACHHGHTASWTYCLSCHNFDLKIPYGAVASQLPSVALPSVEKVPENIKTFRKLDMQMALRNAGYLQEFASSVCQPCC